MKNLLLTGVLILGLGFTTLNANSAAKELDRHIVAMDYNTEGVGIGEFTKEKLNQSQYLVEKYSTKTIK